MVSMSASGPWLTDRQQTVWRRWLALNSALTVALHRQLQEDSGLSLPDFEVLVQLTEVTGARVRITDLAAALGWERSRLSHHVRRMESRGLVDKEECLDDGRGAYVVLTREGRTAIRRAAPAHARTVRRLMFDALGDDELDVLAEVTDRALRRLEAEHPTA
jgi:DNA-binding MarR family transcriptional regulator